MSHFRIYIPTRTLFGAGMVKELHNQQLPGKKAMIVISNGRSTKDNGYLNTVEAELQQAGVETAVFDQVEANPLKSTVMAGAAFAKENNCDFLVALGGGSVMDASKANGIHGHESRRYMGLHQWRNRKRTNDGKQAPTPGLRYHPLAEQVPKPINGALSANVKPMIK